MLSVRTINVFTPRAHVYVSYTPWLAKTTMMAVSCCAFGCAFGCANRFGALYKDFFTDYQHCGVSRKQLILSVKDQNLGPIEILERICGDYFCII